MKSWCWFVKRMSWASSVIDILHRKRIALKSGPAIANAGDGVVYLLEERVA